MVSHKLKSYRLELTVFWLRYRDLFLISPFIIFLTVFLSITMYQRFASLESAKEHSLEQIQGINIKGNTENLNNSY